MYRAISILHLSYGRYLPQNEKRGVLRGFALQPESKGKILLDWSGSSRRRGNAFA